jgi:hypothetical protein
VAWNVDGFSYLGGVTTVTYTVQNHGKVDLTGVNLEIGVDVGGVYVIRWTPDFSLSQNRIVHGSLGIPTGPGPIDAAVLGIDMDDPKA